jgi:hypothetical protein
MFLTGSQVKGGLAGTYPSLEKQDDGDLIHTVDFRSVYATLLEKWLGCEAEKVLGEKFPLLKLVQAQVKFAGLGERRQVCRPHPRPPDSRNLAKAASGWTVAVQGALPTSSRGLLAAIPGVATSSHCGVSVR